ncbi:MAG TPA: hypothetical protein VET90_00960 [Candidatus Binatus sp.]|nr:hypothetical protein [Candidatus Binatus sp.]
MGVDATTGSLVVANERLAGEARTPETEREIVVGEIRHLRLAAAPLAAGERPGL